MSKKLKQRLKSFKKWFIPEIKYRLKQRSGGAIDYKNVPIVINNFNRLSMLLRLIASLESSIISSTVGLVSSLQISGFYAEP